MGSKGATTTSTSAPPQAVQDMYKYLTEQGKTLQQQPYQPYTGQMVAELNPIQQQGIQQAQQYSQAAQPYFQGAAAGTMGAMQGYTPEGFQQGVGGYMSPYLQNAMGSTAAYLGNQQAQQRQELIGKTIASGAFGGDRGKIAQAALAGQQNLASGEILSKMAQQGYSDAAKNYLASLGAQGALASQLGTLGTGAQTAGLQGAQAVTQAGGTPYQIEQSKLAAQYGQFAQGQAYPFQTLGYLANIASGLGAGQGGTSTTTSPGPNVLGQAFGTALAIGSLPFSDKRLKEDISEIGETFDGQPIYSFKYKGDDKTQIGLMAQDVEKKHPEAVGLAGGYKTVDYEKATEGAAERGEFYLGGASMGGLVPANQDRQAYATKGSVSVIPYEDDPLRQLMDEYTKIQLAKYIPDLRLSGDGMGIPKAPAEYKDETSEYIKGLQAMPELQKSRLAKNLGSAYSGLQSYLGFADGGLVPREPHKDGLAVEPVTDQGLGKKPQTVPVSFIEQTFNQNKPFSDEARAGLLSAGLGMLASRSPYLGSAIGEGAIGGMNTYYNALKSKVEAAKTAADIGKTEAETAETKSKLYEKVWLQGMGWFVYDKTKPMSAPQQITDAEMNPIGRIRPEDVPTASGSPQPETAASGTTTPSTSVPSVPLTTETKQPEPKKSEWSPNIKVPKGYMPEEQANIMFSEESKASERKLADETLKVARAESQSAYDQLFRMNEMDKQFANLDDQGFLSPGSYAPERMALAKDANTFVQILGGSAIFDPNDVASMESLSKDTFRLGTELTRSLGANEPGKIVEAAVKANPGIENTKLAYRRIIAGLKEAAMYKRDRAAFYSDYAAKFGHLSGADQLFAKLNPPERYAQRAIIGTVDPRDIAEARKYIQNNPDYPDVAKSAIDKKYGVGVADMVLGK
jgi:hypothetical protein